MSWEIGTFQIVTFSNTVIPPLELLEIPHF